MDISENTSPAPSYESLIVLIVYSWQCTVVYSVLYMVIILTYRTIILSAKYYDMDITNSN